MTPRPPAEPGAAGSGAVDPVVLSSKPMNQYLYLLRPTRLDMLTTGPTAEEAATVGAHFEYLHRLLAAGLVLMVGRTQNNDASTFGIAVFEAESQAAAEAIMNGDPAVRGGVMRAELYPYRVALWSAAGPSAAI